MFQPKNFIFTFIVISSVALLVGCGNGKQTADEGIDVDTFGVLINKISNCSRLYTSEYHVRKIITHDDQLKLQGKILSQSFDVNLPLGERKIAIPIDGVVKGYIDFSQFDEKNIRRRGQKIEITLPDPEIILTSTSIDHDAIMEHVPLLRSDFSDRELSAYEQKGRQAIIRSIPKMGIEQQARQAAANVLIPIIAQMGFKESDITITFRRDLDIKSRIVRLSENKAS